jgi:uncharacterized protein YndB with AHSA1/START domain
MSPVAYTLINSVRAPTDTVFAALSDPVRMPAWLPGCTDVQSGGPFQKGARFTVHFGARQTEFEIVDFARPSALGWVERGGRKGWKTFFRLDAVGGATTITIRAVWIPHSFLAWLRGRFMEKRKGLRQLEEILRNLRSVLQGVIDSPGPARNPSDGTA